MNANQPQLRAQIFDEISFLRVFTQYHISEQQMADLLATETYHPPGFKIPRHAHELPSFYLILEGSMTEFLPRDECERRRHTVVFTPPGEMHSNEFHGNGARCFLIEFMPNWFERLKTAGIDFETSVSSNNPETTRLATSLYKEFHSGDKAATLFAEGLCLEILGAFSRQADQKYNFVLPRWLEVTRDLLHDRFSETLTLDDIAREVEIHPVHLARTFRKRFHCSVGQYQRRLRVEHAARQLLSTECSLIEIALASGFADQAHFSRVFKDHTGMTPARFRVQHTAVGQG